MGVLQVEERSGGEETETEADGSAQKSLGTRLGLRPETMRKPPVSRRRGFRAGRGRARFAARAIRAPRAWREVSRRAVVPPRAGHPPSRAGSALCFSASAGSRRAGGAGRPTPGARRRPRGRLASRSGRRAGPRSPRSRSRGSRRRRTPLDATLVARAVAQQRQDALAQPGDDELAVQRLDEDVGQQHVKAAGGMETLPGHGPGLRAGVVVENRHRRAWLDTRSRSSPGMCIADESKEPRPPRILLAGQPMQSRGIREDDVRLERAQPLAGLGAREGDRARACLASAGSGVRYSTPCGSVQRRAMRGRAGRRRRSLSIQKHSTAHM